MKSCLNVGGQAVIEGVMMRSPNYVATAVRTPDNKIVVQKKKQVSWTKKNKLFGWPFVRGIIILGETLSLGMKALSWSTDQSLGEEENVSGWEMFFSILVGVILALVIFKFLPLLLANIFKNKLGLNNFLFNIIDGAIKIGMFVAYVWIISLMKDVRRVFQYHGAEHKAVHCYEKGLKLNVKNVKKHTTLHPRCGTAFLLIVIIVSIIFYMFIPFNLNLATKYLLRILLLPLIAGVAYEIIKASGKYDNWLTRIISAPGLWMQKITTKEPDNKQIEVGIKALETVLKAEKVKF
jgi:uncharacterized protein YqhQ